MDTTNTDWPKLEELEDLYNYLAEPGKVTNIQTGEDTYGKCYYSWLLTESTDPPLEVGDVVDVTRYFHGWWIAQKRVVDKQSITTDSGFTSTVYLLERCKEVPVRMPPRTTDWPSKEYLSEGALVYVNTVDDHSIKEQFASHWMYWLIVDDLNTNIHVGQLLDISDWGDWILRYRVMAKTTIDNKLVALLDKVDIPGRRDPKHPRTFSVKKEIGDECDRT